MLPLRFVPYHELGDRPNVVVDGAAAPTTVLTHSHWPGRPTPPELLDDLSAQIAFHALAEPERFAGVDLVSNNHFDQDGLVSAFALVDPDAARARRGPLVDLARAGDFGTFESRDAIRLAFAIAAFEDPARSPLDADVLSGSYEQQCGRLYEVLLPRLPQLVDHPESVLVSEELSFRIPVELRYETWVMFRSRPVLPRPDLRLLAGRLDEREPGPARWTADGPGALTPHLRADGSELPPEIVRAEVESFLASAPAAWDPYHVNR